MALSLYRKYRPNIFADVVGQEHVVKTLVNAVSEGSVAHAYMFCGPRGTGKTTTARLLAKALLCSKGPNTEPDGSCQQCLDIAQGTHPDVYELDAASRTGVENVREEIIGRVNFAPTRGRYKVYIIDEVHMLSTAAFNALLKTLEEPPDHVVFVLCTTDPQKVPETIQSRCQRFDFRRFSIDEITTYLTRICRGEGFMFESEALEYLAAKSNGGMRDATTSLEQMAVYSNGTITLQDASKLFGQTDTSGLFELADYIAAHDAARCFEWVARLMATGTDLAQFARELSTHVRNLYVVELTGGQGGLVACPEAQLPRYADQAQRFGAERLSRALTVCGELVSELRWSSDARLSVEIACIRLCRPDSDLTLEGLSERIAQLEQGTFVPAAGAAPAYGAPAAQVSAVEPEPVRVAEPAQMPEPAGDWMRTEAARGAAGQEQPQTGQAGGLDSAPAQVAEPAQSFGAGERVPQDAAGQVQQQVEPVGNHPATAAAAAAGGRHGVAQRPSPEEQVAAGGHSLQGQHGVSEPQEGAAFAAAGAAHGTQSGSASAAGLDAASNVQPQANAQAVALGASMTPARLMQAVLSEVKRTDVATGALLSGVSLTQEGDTYHLEFPQTAQFAMTVASKGQARELIGKAFEHALGAPAHFDCRIASGTPAHSDPAAGYALGGTGGFSGDAAAPEADDGYYDALEQSASYYAEDSGAGACGQQDAAPVIIDAGEPDFDAPGGSRMAPLDDKTAASLADALSAFGTGVKVREIE